MPFVINYMKASSTWKKKANYKNIIQYYLIKNKCNLHEMEVRISLSQVNMKILQTQNILERISNVDVSMLVS